MSNTKSAALQALGLARSGAPLRAIADRLYEGDVESALADVAHALHTRIDFDADDTARLDLERIDTALLAMAPQLQAGDTQAIAMMMTLMDRRDRIAAKLHRRSTPGPIRRATDEAIRGATHLTKADKGAVAALRRLADALDYLVEHDGQSPKGSLDNVTGPTYLRYCESLGLTPAGRGKRSGITESSDDKPKGGQAVIGRQSKVRELRSRHQAAAG